jgi:hypothetical protein
VGALPGLDRLSPGAHVCCVVDSSAEFEQWTADCLAEGAQRGEKLFRFGPQPQSTNSTVQPHTEPAVTMVDPRRAFLGGGPVDPMVMYAMFRDQTALARREGYRGLRLVADMDWLLPVMPSRPELTAFELLLDQVVTELAATVVCAYRRQHFDAPTIAEMVAVHPVTVGAVSDDPDFRMWNLSGHVWQVAGEVDFSNAEPFSRALAVAASQTPVLRLKTTGLTFIAVAGVRAIMQLALSRPELQLIINDAGPPLRLCWELLELDRHLSNVELVPSAHRGPLADAERSTSASERSS